jgi:tRNA 2-thiouridine synthesizing protein A
LATDPGAIKDFEAFCKTTGYRLLAASQDENLLTFDIQKT